MSLGERAALEGLLAVLRPKLAIEIGTLKGGSLEVVSAYTDAVHAFDLRFDATVTQERFPNAVFHEGDSHRLLPEALARFADEGANVDFILVDGDHSAAGVRRDLEDLLASPSVANSVILVHDTLNERVRLGLGDVDFEQPKVTHVELDFVVGRIWGGGGYQGDFWGGLGIVVTGFPVVSGVDIRPLYDAVDVFSTFRSRLNGGDAVVQAPYGELRVLEEQLRLSRESNALMEQSLSWRITAPLRRAKSLVRRSS
jgi:hypothetical protein